MNKVALDTHELVKELKAAGFSEQQAEAVTRAVTKAQEVDLSHLATKADLQIALAELKAEILKWMFGAMVAQTGLIVALLKVL